MMMEREVEIREIRDLLLLLNRKMDVLIGERETLSMMQVSEASLVEFFEGEPELYTLEDVRVRYP
jgi:hypothetical protein